MKVIDLSGNKWNFKCPITSKLYPAKVPGCIHTDLLRAKAIDDPFYRDNEQKQFWIGESDWLYLRSFNVPASVLKHDKVLMRCEGLDTLATIKLNGKTIGKTDNMFRTYEFDVKKLLKCKDNKIEVMLGSPIKGAAKLNKKNPFESSGRDHKMPNVAQLRKEQCNFGWDWGPKCATSGIWRPIKIVAFNTARISDLLVEQKMSGKSATLGISVDLEKLSRAGLKANVAVTQDGKIVDCKAIDIAGSTKTTSIKIVDPKLWWPSGMGDQPLYTVEVTVATKDGKVLDTCSKRIGIRTLKLIQKKDKWGLSFNFEANGIPFYAKGANWIPADQFQDRVTPDIYRSLLQSSVDANMNMIRVWGGGIYEQQEFYDICDELGLCVWQDFIFACAAYPANDKKFMANVKIEAEENVKRIRHHACLALWCGNNEIEQCGFVRDDGRDGSMKWKDYSNLFDVLLKNTVEKHCPSVAYWPSSEHTPIGDRAKSSHPDSGDGHLWNVWHGKQPFEWYRTSLHRFCSEFGFQSFPEPKTIKEYTVPTDQNVTSRIMELHQRSGIGNSTIMHYMLSWYRLPTGFINTVWVSQLQQGLAIKYAVEHWRRNMHRCMGALYWQLNDCWQVASWASIDYRGRWKALHYMAKKFFAPLLISGLEDGDKSTVELHITSDKLEPVKGTYKWRLTQANGRTVRKGQKNITIKPNGSSKVSTLNFRKETAKISQTDLMVWLELVVGGKVVSRNFVSFKRPKHMELLKPEIKSVVSRKSDKVFTIKLKSKNPALWAWLELEKTDAVFEDSWICLEPGKTVSIKVETKKSLTLAQFKKQLKVRSLYDTYQ